MCLSVRMCMHRTLRTYLERANGARHAVHGGLMQQRQVRTLRHRIDVHHSLRRSCARLEPEHRTHEHEGLCGAFGEGACTHAHRRLVLGKLEHLLGDNFAADVDHSNTRGPLAFARALHTKGLVRCLPLALGIRLRGVDPRHRRHPKELGLAAVGVVVCLNEHQGACVAESSALARRVRQAQRLLLERVAIVVHC